MSQPTPSDDEIDEALRGGAWRREGDAIARDLAFADFAAALAFVNRAGAAAEAANHHPDLLLHGYDRVRVTLSTHDAGGVTQADLDLAAQLDGLEAG